MFGFSKPRPPLTTYQRVDIELLMRKTIETVGVDAVRQATVIRDVSELALDASTPQTLIESAAREVRQRMNLADVQLDLEIADGSKLQHLSTYKAAAAEGCSTIVLADDTTGDPLRTVMELAYQYSYHFWRTQPQPTPLDLEPRNTNLMPLCFGFGVLASDASLYDNQWSQPGWSGWSLSRSGFYSAIEIGYAMALWSRTRGETKPAWIRSLRLDSRATAQQAWRFFAHHRQSGGDLLFDSAKIPSSKSDMNELAGWLAGNDLAFALAAGYALSHLDDLPPRVIDAALVATRSGDPSVVPVAVRLLAGAQHDSPDVVNRVHQLIRSDSAATSLAALQAANVLGSDLSPYSAAIAKLIDYLGGQSPELLGVIADQGTRLKILVPPLCKHIGAALQTEDDELTVDLLACLVAISDDPAAALTRHLKSHPIQTAALQQLEKLT
jgi:hypothetical protein